MSTYTYDDGSTIDTDTGAATSAPAGMLLTDYASNFAPGNLTPGATNWLDVLKYGFGRVADYKTASLQAQNPQPAYAAPVAPVQPSAVFGGKSLGSLLLVGGGIVAAILLLTGGRR